MVSKKNLSLPQLEQAGREHHIGEPFARLEGNAAHDLLENLFRQSYRLLGLEFFRLLVQYLARALNVRSVLIAGPAPEGKIRTFAFWLDQMLVDETVYELGHAPCAHVVEKNELCYRQRVTAVYPTYCQQLGVQANYYLGIPLKTATGELVGHLSFLDDRPIQLPPQEWVIWSAILARAGLELERMRVMQNQVTTLRDIESRAEQLTILYEMALDLTPTTDWLKLMQVISERVCHLLDYPARSFYIELYLKKDDGLQLKRAYPVSRKPTYLCEPPTAQLRNYVAQSGEAHVSSTLSEESFLYLLPEDAAQAHIVRSSLTLPLLLGKELVGLLYIGINRSHMFTPDQVGALLAFGDMLADLLQRMMYTSELQTKLAKVQKELAEAQARCDALTQLRAKLIYDVAHELFMPATSIRLYLDLLAYCRMDKSARRYVALLQDKTQQLVKFAEDALHLSRLEKQASTSHIVPVRLQHDLLHLLDLYGQVASRAGLQFIVELGEQLPAVSAEPNQLRQAVAALLDNAIAYTPKGEVVVKTAVNPNTNHLGLLIQDSGIGIETADYPYLFNRFYRGRPAIQRNPSGNGLGLAIAEEIAGRFDGWIEFESQPFVGSVFRIWLPLA